MLRLDLLILDLLRLDLHRLDLLILDLLRLDLLRLDLLRLDLLRVRKLTTSSAGLSTIGSTTSGHDGTGNNKTTTMRFNMNRFTAVLLAVFAMAISTYASGVAYTGTFTIPAGVTNASQTVVLGGADKVDAFALDKVFVITPANTYTGAVTLAMVNCGYSTTLATDASVLLNAPFLEYPRRTVLSYQNTISYDLTNGVTRSTIISTNQIPYMVKELNIGITVNGGSKTAAREIEYIIYAD